MKFALLYLAVHVDSRLYSRYRLSIYIEKNGRSVDGNIRGGGTETNSGRTLYMYIKSDENTVQLIASAALCAKKACGWRIPRASVQR